MIEAHKKLLNDYLDATEAEHQAQQSWLRAKREMAESDALVRTKSSEMIHLLNGAHRNRRCFSLRNRVITIRRMKREGFADTVSVTVDKLEKV